MTTSKLYDPRAKEVRVPHSVTESSAYAALSGRAVKLLLDVARFYDGTNNGELSMTWKVMQPRGWRSPVTLKAAETELLAAGFLCRTRPGHAPNVCSLYAITWLPLPRRAERRTGR